MYDVGSQGQGTKNVFLSEDNFTTSERNAIKSVVQKSVLNAVDVDKLITWDAVPNPVLARSSPSIHGNVIKLSLK